MAAMAWHFLKQETIDTMDMSIPRRAKVLVVDDSAAMRALFCEILEQTEGVEVIGTAASADQARDMIREIRPNVITLDIDMPGTNGLVFLEEMMKRSPMPVVVLSALSQKGTKMTKQAMELGAVACFGKPLKANAAQFAKASKALGEAVLEASGLDIWKHVEALKDKQEEKAARQADKNG
jgi:two-component system chemotaxis response regulator CheB